MIRCFTQCLGLSDELTFSPSGPVSPLAPCSENKHQHYHHYHDDQKPVCRHINVKFQEMMANLNLSFDPLDKYEFLKKFLCWCDVNKMYIYITLL